MRLSHYAGEASVKVRPWTSVTRPLHLFLCIIKMAMVLHSQIVYNRVAFRMPGTQLLLPWGQAGHQQDRKTHIAGRR